MLYVSQEIDRNSLLLISFTGLGFLPGLFHAWYIIASYPEPTYEQLEANERGEGGNVTYYYVQSQPAYAPQQGGYGSINQSVSNAQFPAQQQGTVPASAPSGSNNEVPPSYQQAVAGDHKVQGP